MKKHKDTAMMKVARIQQAMREGEIGKNKNWNWLQKSKKRLDADMKTAEKAVEILNKQDRKNLLRTAGRLSAMLKIDKIDHTNFDYDDGITRVDYSLIHKVNELVDAVNKLRRKK